MENFVAQRSSTKQEKFGALLAEGEVAESQARAVQPDIKTRTDTKALFHIGIVLVCCAIVVFRIFMSVTGQGALTPQQVAAEERTRNQIEACMLVFWEIAEVLAAGRTPGDNLRCEETGLPMNVTTSNGDLRISHPRPDLLGLTDIFVTRSNPVPILVE